ncbi:MAG TPA: alanine racemase [Anaerolineales bacterium]|nr:alanine racemase [Anaerolineales bacterium]
MRPTHLEVNLSQLRQNLENIRAHVAPAKVMAVLKANAYGHGVDGVAPYIAPYADYIGVAIVEEAIHLRELGIEKPILVMGGTLAEQVPAFVQYALTLAVSSLELLDVAEQVAAGARTRLKVHLKIDTGMERIGVHDYEAEPFLEKSLACSHLEIEGIFTHFANSESTDLNHARLQFERFQNVLRFYERRSAPHPPIRHAANSGAILQLPESHLDMVRPGVMFYGVYPGRAVQRTVRIKPALTWYSHVAHSKVTQPGRPVSYGSLWQPEIPTRIVTIPCGYADGYFRGMTNRAQVVIHGRRYPEVGRICMDQFMVDLGGEEARVGDEVILLGGGITAEDLADWAGTNEYEVMTNISARVPRVFIT